MSEPEENDLPRILGLIEQCKDCESSIGNRDDREEHFTTIRLYVSGGNGNCY
jgi:hypothetical protein